MKDTDTAPTRHPITCAADFSGGLAWMERECRATLRQLSIRERARAYFRARELAAKADLEREGFTWRGWWYPSWLVGAVLGLATVAAFALLAWGLFRHPVLGA